MRRISLIFLGIGAILIGVVILVRAGLPDRATHTGYFISGVTLPIAAEVGVLAPQIQHTSLNGDDIDLWALRGKPVLINFWATWCAPCLAEMPDLQAIYEDYQPLGLRILAVNLSESPTEIESWVARFQLTFDILPDDAGDILKQYPRHGPPATYLVSPDGIITRIDYGPIHADTLRGYLETMFLADEFG
jgi:thiol-disulfide isomerase/thioredoxin